MSGWIALHRSEKAWTLLTTYPAAFHLLTVIAWRARREDCEITGLKAGQARIGDWKATGMASEKAYRVAKNRLKRGGLVAFQGANKGTVATILDSTIYTIYREQRGEQGGENGAGQGRTRGGQGATNKKERRKEGKKKTTGRFTPPSLEDVSGFMAEKGVNGNHAQAFIDFYESKNWMVGKNKMVNWKSAASGWINRGRDRGEIPMQPEPVRRRYTEEEKRAALERS